VKVIGNRKLIWGVLALLWSTALLPAIAVAQFDDELVFASDESSDPFDDTPLTTKPTPASPATQSPRPYYTGASTPGPLNPGAAVESSLSRSIMAAPSASPLTANSNAASAIDCHGDCCCDGCDCGYCCDSCWPRWYVEAEAIFLWRNTDVRTQSVVRSSPSGVTVLNSRSPDFDSGIGPRALIGIRTSECTAWECQYFSALDMTGTASIASPNSLTAAGQIPNLPGWRLFNAADVQCESELHNVEINYVRSWNGLSLLGGFRFVRLTDRFGLNIYDTGTSDLYNVHCANDLYGAQLGGRWRECCGKFYYEFTGKAGVFGNDANTWQYLTSADQSQIQRNFTNYQNSTAFVGDLNLSIGYRLNKVWAARCGYNVLWIDQVAMSADQLDFNVIPGSGRQMSTDGDVFLHGVNVGLEGRW
jgi:hypothetical protein